MMTSWIFFIGGMILMYIGTTVVGKYTGSVSTSGLESIQRLLNPVVIASIVVINTAFAFAIYHGLLVSANAIPISLVIGVLVTYILSIVFLNGQFEPIHILGIVLLVAGIALLK